MTTDNQMRLLEMDGAKKKSSNNANSNYKKTMFGLTFATVPTSNREKVTGNHDNEEEKSEIPEGMRPVDKEKMTRRIIENIIHKREERLKKLDWEMKLKVIWGNSSSVVFIALIGVVNTIIVFFIVFVQPTVSFFGISDRRATLCSFASVFGLIFGRIIGYQKEVIRKLEDMYLLLFSCGILSFANYIFLVKYPVSEIVCCFYFVICSLLAQIEPFLTQLMIKTLIPEFSAIISCLKLTSIFYFSSITLFVMGLLYDRLPEEIAPKAILLSIIVILIPLNLFVFTAKSRHSQSQIPFQLDLKNSMLKL